MPIEIRFAGTLAGFEGAFGDLRALLDRDGLDARTRYKVELVFEEVVANIVRHGARDGVVPDVCVALDVGTDAVVMTIDDDGPPFDPCSRADPVLPASLDEARVGGLGLLMVRRAATRVEYQPRPDCGNRLVVTLPATRREAAG